MTVYEAEELMWQRRGGENWLLKGDSNTGYFHGVANGRKRKCLIKSLMDGDRVIEDKEELKKYITDFYKGLFGSESEPRIKLGSEFWNLKGRVDELDNQLLVKLSPWISWRM